MEVETFDNDEEELEDERREEEEERPQKGKSAEQEQENYDSEGEEPEATTKLHFIFERPTLPPEPEDSNTALIAVFLLIILLIVLSGLVWKFELHKKLFRANYDVSFFYVTPLNHNKNCRSLPADKELLRLLMPFCVAHFANNSRPPSY